MCVIIHKPYGKTIDVLTLHDACTHNPHGIGIAYIENDRVHAERGIDFESLCSWANRDIELLIHLRYATHGIIDNSMCHPFPVTSDRESHTYKSFSFEGDLLMHNGIIFSYGDKQESDTLQFTRDCLAYLRTHADRVKLLRGIPSKFALISPKKITLIGDFEEYQGSKYSNLYFLEDKYLFDYDAHCKDVPLHGLTDAELEEFYGGYIDYDYNTRTHETRSNRGADRDFRKTRKSYRCNYATGRSKR